MPIHKSDLIAAKDSLAVSDKSKFSANRTNAKVLQATAVYTFKGTEIPGDIIELVDLPAGATVIPHQSFVADSTPSALSYGAANIHLGVPADQRFGYAEGVYAGTSRSFSTQVSHEGIPLEKETRVVAHLGYIPNIPAGKKLAFGISYAING